jgi:hypothetical protein
MLTQFQKVKKFIKEGESENFKIEHFELSEEFVRRERFRGALAGGAAYQEVYDLVAGEYVRLIDKRSNSIVMSDTPMELNTNREFIENAKGDILIGGLGMGLIVMSIQNKKEVKSITIVEKEKEVIDLMKDFPFNKKVKIIEADIFTYTPEQTFDYLYFDIWYTISADNYEEMKTLNKRYKKFKKVDGVMDSWRLGDCKRRAYALKRESF